MADIIDDSFLAGYASGYAAGIERGRAMADDDAAALHHRAYRIVQAAANLPNHEEAVAARRAAYARPRPTPAPWPEAAPIDLHAAQVVLTPREQQWERDMGVTS